MLREIGEREGVERIRRRDAASAEPLEKWLRRTVQAYNDRIIGVDMAIAQRSASTTSTCPASP